MSQYRLRRNGFLYLYGYDRPLAEYFFAKFDKDEEPVFSVSNRCTLEEHPDYPGQLDFSNRELLEMVKRELGDDAPEDFMEALALDIPI